MKSVSGQFKTPYESGGYQSPQNPQVEFVVSKVCTLKMLFSTNLGHGGNGIIFFLTKPEREDGRVSSLSMSDIIAQSPYVRTNNVSIEYTAAPGRYIVVLCLQHSGRSGQFKFEISSFVDYVRVVKDYRRKVVDGVWDRFNGGVNSPENPQYAYTVTDKTTRLLIRLVDEDESNPILIFICKGSKFEGRRRILVDESEIIAKSVYLRATEVSLDIDLEPSKRPYYIIPCSGNRAKKKPFKLIIESDTIKGTLGKIAEMISHVVVEDEVVMESGCEEILKKHRDLENPPYMVTNPVPDIIEFCKKNNCVFRDPDFTASEESINKSDGRKSVEKIPGVGGWKRPMEFLENPELYVDGIEIQDMIQGACPDCWVCQGIATAGMREERIVEAISPSTCNKCGVYAFRMWHEDAFKWMVIDDYIPVSRETGSYIFARSQDPDEIWVPLFEKAFAKAFGSYRGLTKRSVTISLTILTGGETSIINHEDHKIDELWDQMATYDSRRWMMGASSGLEDAEGIKGRHAYSIMSVHDIYNNKKLRLLKIRNTWGEFEWEGAWGDDDNKRWTEDLKKKLNFQKLDDGIFHMCIEDYFKHFHSTSFCRILADIYPFSCKYRGDWSSPNNKWMEPKIPLVLNENSPIIPFEVFEDNTAVHCNLMRTSDDAHFLDVEKNSILLYLIEGEIKSNVIPENQIYEQSKFMIAITAKFETVIEKKGVYHFIPTSTNREEEYTILINSSKKVKLGGEYNDPFGYQKSIRGDWEPCKGVLMVKNPQVKLQLLEAGDTEMVLDLSRADDLEKKFGMFLVICKPGIDLEDPKRHPQVQNYEVIQKSRYLLTKGLSMTVTLKYNKDPYTLLLCNEKEWEGLKYQIGVKAKKKFKLFGAGVVEVKKKVINKPVATINTKLKKKSTGKKKKKIIMM